MKRKWIWVAAGICLSTVFVLAIPSLLSLAIHIWYPDVTEYRLISAVASPDGHWTAMVDVETYSTGPLITVVHDIVRLKRTKQAATDEDLVLVVEDGQATPRTSWSNDGPLVITLAKDEPYTYFKKSVHGVPVALSWSTANDK